MVQTSKQTWSRGKEMFKKKTFVWLSSAAAFIVVYRGGVGRLCILGRASAIVGDVAVHYVACFI